MIWFDCLLDVSDKYFYVKDIGYLNDEIIYLCSLMTTFEVCLFLILNQYHMPDNRIDEHIRDSMRGYLHCFLFNWFSIKKYTYPHFMNWDRCNCHLVTGWIQDMINYSPISLKWNIPRRRWFIKLFNTRQKSFIW